MKSKRTLKKKIHEELIEQLKYLRLSGLALHWDAYLKTAADKHFSHAELLKFVVEQECRLKYDNARVLRVKRADIPECFVLETFPFDKQPKLNKSEIFALYDSAGFINDSYNIIWLGRTGCGKTGLATSFLLHAIDLGYTGRYVLFADLIDDFYRAAADHSESEVLKKYLSYDCLLVDELGYVEMEPAQVGSFFTLMHKRHKKKPTLITSNLGFSQWRAFLKNDQLTAALIDRLTENSHVFNMKQCVGLRPKIAPHL